MSKPAPREWTLYSHYSTDNDAMKWSTTRDSEITLEVEKPERIKVIERSAYDRLAEENKILKNVLVGGEYNYNSVRETLALMAEGEGSDYKFYMHMAKHALTILDEALKRVEVLE